jgi:hypothetical protein
LGASSCDFQGAGLDATPPEASRRLSARVSHLQPRKNKQREELSFLASSCNEQPVAQLRAAASHQ